MISQLEFSQIVDALPAAAGRNKPKRMATTAVHDNAADFALGLAAALHRHQLKHETFHLMLSIARQQARRGFATMLQTSLELSVTLNAVHIALRRKNDLIAIETATTGRHLARKHISLMPDGIALLSAILKTARKTARNASVLAQPGENSTNTKDHV